MGLGILDLDFVGVGVWVVGDVELVWGDVDLVLKVKEFVVEEYGWLYEGLVFFMYFYLVVDEVLICEFLGCGVMLIVYEMVELVDYLLLLLFLMLEIVGWLVV